MAQGHENVSSVAGGPPSHDRRLDGSELRYTASLFLGILGHHRELPRGLVGFLTGAQPGNDGDVPSAHDGLHRCSRDLRALAARGWRPAHRRFPVRLLVFQWRRSSPSDCDSAGPARCRLRQRLRESAAEEDRPRLSGLSGGT